ncbi:MAG: WecB/TagA/CpsF family glycosyltransferase [Elusimicrobia bacterium]|nr:WecB/TagA/CpsF family glycosyltransferase [Candidatus Obscuribacterium magneticum]
MPLLNPPLSKSTPKGGRQQIPRVEILGVPLHSLSKERALGWGISFMLSDHAHHLITANSLFALETQKSAALQEACTHASLILAESSGLAWAAQKLGLTPPPVIPGIDLAYDLCHLAEILSVPVYLLGGRPGVSKEAVSFLTRKFPNLLIAGMRDGYFKPHDDEAIIRDMTLSRSKLFLVALGMPKQELWIHKNRRHLPPGLFVGVGGTFDVWAGQLKRAPLWIRNRGLEWLYRLSQEPSRLRRISRLPQFALHVFISRK